MNSSRRIKRPELPSKRRPGKKPGQKNQPVKAASPNSRHTEVSGKPKYTLSRKVRVKRYPVLASLIFERPRPDMQALLETMQASKGSLPERLVQYLIKEKLWNNEYHQLTEAGLQVLNSGVLPARERGLYHIWYTDSDPLLGTRPLLIQRDNAFRAPEHNVLFKNSDARRQGFCVDAPCTVLVSSITMQGHKSQDKEEKLRLLSLATEVVCETNAEATVDLSWRLESDSSCVELDGNLAIRNVTAKAGSKGAQDKSIQLTLKLDQFGERYLAVMQALSDTLNGDWHEEKRRVSLACEHIEQFADSRQVLQQFVVASHKTRVDIPDAGRFSVDAGSLPVMPATQEDAEDWYQAWLSHTFSCTYKPSAQSQKTQAQWLDHSAIRNFDLPARTGQALLESFSREAEPVAHWHVAALMDLSPGKGRKQPMPLTLMDGEQNSISALLGQLTGGDTIQHFTLSDRYIRTRKQQRNLEMMASALPGSSGHLHTLTDEIQLPGNWQRSTFEKQHDNHDRYWIFQGRHLHYWKCSGGLDFISQIDVSGTFTVAGTPTFTPIEYDQLPGYLKDALPETGEITAMEETV